MSGGTRLSTFLSTQTSALTLKSPFLSGSTLASALLGTSWRALGPPEPTSKQRRIYDGKWCLLQKTNSEDSDPGRKESLWQWQRDGGEAPPLLLDPVPDRRVDVTGLDVFLACDVDYASEATGVESFGHHRLEQYGRQLRQI